MTSEDGQADIGPQRVSSTYWRPKKLKGPVAAIIGRWWWLLVPFVGIVCAEGYVTPYVADAQNDINKVTRFKSDRLQELTAEWQTAENELFAVEATIDTFFVPELEWHDSVLDSLRNVRSDITASFPLLETQIGTLNEQLVALDEPIQETAELRTQRGQEIDLHRENIAALRDSLQGLILEQEALRDRLDRLENPDKYERSRGLISPGG